MSKAPRRLGTAAWPEVESGATVLIPLGSTEQHGPHLPLDTDAQIAQAVANRASELRPNLWVAPVLSYGSSGEHAAFRGTLSIGTDTLHAVLVELVRSAASSFDATVFVNGHGGNVEAIMSASAQMRAEGHNVTQWWPTIPGGDAHAGRTETSLMLAIDPGSVRQDLAAAGATQPLRELLPMMRERGVAAVSANGVLGDPAGASAEEGDRLLVELANDLVAQIG